MEEKLEPSCSLLHAMLDRKVDGLGRSVSGLHEEVEKQSERTSRILNELSGIKGGVLSSLEGIMQVTSSLHSVRDDVHKLQERIDCASQTSKSDSDFRISTFAQLKKHKSYTLASIVTALTTLALYAAQAFFSK